MVRICPEEWLENVGPNHDMEIMNKFCVLLFHCLKEERQTCCKYFT